MSAFANFEVGCLIKKMEKSAVSNFLYVFGTVYFTYFESFNVYKNTCRLCYVFEKACNCPVLEI